MMISRRIRLATGDSIRNSHNKNTGDAHASQSRKMNMSKLASTQFIPNKFRTFAAALALGPLALAACSKQDAPTGPIEPRMIAVGGNAQAGFVDSVLPLAFVVRVNDRSNRGVPGVPIEWRITSGTGDLVSVDDGAPFTVTDARGLAAVSVRPTAPGTITVTASTTTVPGALATFTAFARRVPDVVIHIDPGFDCGDPSTFRGPDSSSDVTVRVGAVVEWVYAESATSFFPCMAVVQSDTVPPGGAPFVGLLDVGARFQFVPEVEGTWVYVDANNGGRGTLTARVP
jgi:hypothetical protein